MLNIHLLRRLTDQRLKALKTSIYGKRGVLTCHCCGIVDNDRQEDYDRHTADLSTISRIQNERDWEKEKWKTV